MKKHGRPGYADYVPVNLLLKIPPETDAGIDVIAVGLFDGNRSAAIRWLLKLGLQTEEARSYFTAEEHLPEPSR